MMNDVMRHKWDRLRAAPIVWLTNVAEALAMVRVVLRVFFRLSIGLWLIWIGIWWSGFVGSAAMYAAEERAWAGFFCPAPKIAVHAACNALTGWELARYALPQSILIGPAFFAFAGGLLLIFASVRAAMDID
jgi:hypothetical protein